MEAVNPTLWNSPDMQGAWGYHANTYFHGPVQYLTLYPMAYFDSYATIAAVLLPIYVALLAGAFFLLRGAINALTQGTWMNVPLFATVFLFFPLLQSMIQREFEVVVFLSLTAALWLLVRDRRTAAGVVLGYIAWFKYVPLMFLGHLGLRRWSTAVAAFVATSAAVLLLSHLVFGLGLFVNNNVPGHAAQVFNVWSYSFERGPYRYFFGTGFCDGWTESETTLTNVRHGLCSVSFRARWVPANVIYLAVCAAIAVLYLQTHVRWERQAVVSADAERWRRALEFSIVTTVYCVFLLQSLLLPDRAGHPVQRAAGALSHDRRLGRLVVRAMSYVLLSAFLVPTSILTRLTGVDVWAFYVKGAWFIWGELALMWLLLSEYARAAEAPQFRSAALTPAWSKSAAHPAATGSSATAT